jgi:transcriptional regulator with PAS, ATPase and Fis domain
MRAEPITKGNRVVGAFSVFRDVTEINDLNREVERITGIAEEFNKQVASRLGFTNLRIIGKNQALKKIISQAVTAAHSDATVLIRGENGAGKELFARLVHNHSGRKEKPLIVINCAAIPESLIESELFGYEEGAFTGSRKGGKLGKVQLAEGGTLFLDEIGDMPLMMQTKLLRVLQERQIEKLGSERIVNVDVRFIAATNQDLEQLIKEKKFRQDLYYRLNIVSLNIPPLRERRDDIVPLALYFLEYYNKKYKKSIGISAELCGLLEDYAWPGNVRELENCIESAVIMCRDKTVLQQEHIPKVLRPHIRAGLDGGAEAVQRQYKPLKEEVREFERHVIQAVLQQCGGGKEAALKKLGISRRSFYRKYGESSAR